MTARADISHLHCLVSSGPRCQHQLGCMTLRR